MGTIRLLPLVAASALGLLTLKAGAIFVGGSALFSGPTIASTDRSFVSPPLNHSKKDVIQSADPATKNLVTGAADKKQPAGKKMAAGDGGARKIISGPEVSSAKSEFAILQSLSKRRKKLDEREKQLILQRNLLKAAEKKLESRIAQIKKMEGKLSSGANKRKNSQSEQYRKLVEMYSKMKPADAAKIFNRLDTEVLAVLVEHMNSRAMASILSAMDPVKAEKLTLTIAQGGVDKTATQSLPKIRGKR